MVSIFPSPLLDLVLTKMRAAANDALGSGSAGSSSTGSAQASSSGASCPAQKQSSTSSPSGQSGMKGKNRKGKAPFSSSSGGSSRKEVYLRVGGCLAPHWRRWQAIGADLGRDRYWAPFLDSPPPLSRTPVSFPTYRAGSPRAQTLRQEVEAMFAKGALEIARDLGSGLYSRLFLVEKASGGWCPVIDLSHLNEFVHLPRFKMETVASVLLCQRGGFSSFPGSEGRVLSDPNPSILAEAIEVHVGGDGLPVPSPVFRTVDRSPGPGITNICLRKCTYAYFGAITYVVCKYMFFGKHKGHVRSTYAKK